jgi:hypothetical protein
MGIRALLCQIRGHFSTFLYFRQRSIFIMLLIIISYATNCLNNVLPFTMVSLEKNTKCTEKGCLDNYPELGKYFAPKNEEAKIAFSGVQHVYIEIHLVVCIPAQIYRSREIKKVVSRLCMYCLELRVLFFIGSDCISTCYFKK